MKKQNSISLLSKAKILISLTMVAVLVCSMSFAISAADVATGYTTANATVFTPMDLFSTTTATSTQSLILKNDADDSVWKFAVDGTTLTTTAYERPHMYKDLDNYIKYSDSNGLASTYAFYGNTNSYAATTYNYTVRTIKFTVANGEKMTFGFTAPATGMYEISAPISAEGTNVKYAVYKTDVSGNRLCLQDWQSYTAAGAFCNLPVFLSVGETVWLEATADDGTVIDIGIPQAVKHTENKGVTDNGNNNYTYTYSVADYLELSAVNGLTYAAFPASTNVNGAWEYGYFKDTVSFGTKASEFKSSLGLGASAIAFNADRTSSALKDALIEAMKNYELMPYGDRFAAYDTSSEQAPKDVLGASNAAVKAASGVMIPDIANNTFTSNFRASTETVTSTDYTQYGNWFEFTAPVSGTAKLSYPANTLGKNFVMLVAKNDYIIYLTVETADITTLELGDLAAGDRITVLYYAFKSATDASALALPTVSLTGTYNTLTLDADGGSDSYEKYVSSGTQVTLPTPAKEGYNFFNWTDGTTTYNGGDTYTVSDDTVLTAVYESLLSTVDYDLDGDYDVDTVDLVILREHLLGLIEIADDRLPYADKNSTQGIDVRDLVYIRGLIAQQA